ncbi:response regulator, partial [Leptospira levettii]
ALKHFQEGNEYDIVISDYNMPEMNGLDFISSLKSHALKSKSKLPSFTIHSSSNEESLYEKGKEIGVGVILLKPIQTNILYESLYDLVSGRHSKKSTNQKETFKPIVTNEKTKVMIVEDNPVNMMLTKTIVLKILQSAIIIEATNGLEAVEHFKKTEPDLILMDIQMPEMNGYDATREIRKLQIGQNVPII